MYMRFRMQIESVMKEVTFRAEPRALKSRAGPRGAGGAGERQAPWGGLGLRVEGWLWWGAGWRVSGSWGPCGRNRRLQRLGLAGNYPIPTGPIPSFYRCGN